MAPRNSSPSSIHQLAPQKNPFLLLFANEEEMHKDYSVCFLNLQAKRVHQTNSTLSQRLRNSRCVGSSHGWLILLDEASDPYLFNPFSSHRISLPPKETFPHMISVSGSHDYGFEIEYSYGVRKSRVSRSITAKDLQECLVFKAVLSLDPFNGNNNYLVLAIYGGEAKIAIYECGDRAWTDLEGKNRPYCDIMCSKNQLFALSERISVESWDLRGPFPVKTMNFQPSFFPKIVTENMYDYNDRERFSSRCYLVESCGDLLLVVRHIGEFVSEDGEAFCEGDLLSDGCSHPLICPYKTLEFKVYKLNFVQQKWEELESLHDRALFLGGNHSMSISTTDAQYSSKCKRNSVYFTDDYWERMKEDYSYGGHDVGVFCLDDKSVEPFKHLDLLQRIDRPPFWLVPNP